MTRPPSTLFARTAPAASMAAALCLAFLPLPVAFAQTHKVEAPQRVTRAVAVYEWTGDLAKPDAARIVPISLFLNGHLEDAGVYLARPIPLAILTGTVYSIETAGEPRGTVDVEYARNLVTRRSATDDNPVSAWYGYGSFIPPPPPRKVAALKASKTVSSISSSVAVPADDDDRPHMIRRPETAPADDTSAAPATPTPADNDPDRPTLRKRDGKQDAARSKSGGGSVTAMNSSLNDDPDRPSMARGKPLGMVAAPELKGLPPNLHQMVAVSDAVTRSQHVFTREWATPSEQPETLVAIQKLAQPRLASYVSSNRLKPIPNSALVNEQLTPFLLSYDGLPTFVYTAEYPVTDGGPVYVTLVVQRLPSDQFQIALASITDATHLDRTPWLRLVDAVDPDAGHRASLLFELRAQTSRQFALYRVVSAKADQIFVTGPIE